MKTKTLIIHGWSDCSDSFKYIKEFLGNKEVAEPETIYYTDYDSREDSLTFNDVADGLHDQLKKNQLVKADGTSDYAFNIIVHSTGGLVIRHWIWRYYYSQQRMQDCPVKKIVMLAPANFGSPLAHKGKSFFGSFVKGKYEWGNFMEVGRKILSGLELASPYQWQLAHKDLLIADSYFNSRQIQLTILTGKNDYSGLRSLVNKPGTDGTVMISGTSVNAAKIIIDCTKVEESYEPLSWKVKECVEDYAFGILEDYNHTSIVKKLHVDKQLVGELVIEALQIDTPEAFSAFRAKLENITLSSYNRKSDASRFQQFIVHAIDDHDEAVEDFMIEFFLRRALGEVRYGVMTEKHLAEDDKSDLEKWEDSFSDELNTILSSEFHTHTADSSYRRFLVDLDELDKLISKARSSLGDIILSMKVHVPQVDKRIRYAVESLQNIVFYDSRQEDYHIKKFFYPNTTTLLELRVNRINDCVTVSLDSRRG